MSRYVPLHGDRVAESRTDGITGHVHGTRHVWLGIEAHVYPDGSLVGYWILADNLTCLRKATPLPIPCEFLGW